MMLWGRLGFESGFEGRKVLPKGIKAGRTTAVEARDEKRVDPTEMVRLIVLSRCLSMMSIFDTHIGGVAILFKTPPFAYTAAFQSSSARSQTCII